MQASIFLVQRCWSCWSLFWLAWGEGRDHSGQLAHSSQGHSNNLTPTLSLQGEEPGLHTEKTQSGFEPEPFTCEGTVLTTTPLCRPFLFQNSRKTEWHLINKLKHRKVRKWSTVGLQDGWCSVLLKTWLWLLNKPRQNQKSGFLRCDLVVEKCL